MIKYVVVCVCFAGVLACAKSHDHRQALVDRIDSLENKLANTYKPGFGEFMSGIQVHHAKLWFAGLNENWPLADFEIHEIGEALDNVRKYQTERVESKKIDMIRPALDTVMMAIAAKNLQQFKSSYASLTNTCNNCHRATHFEFNVVKIPEAPPFSNQSF